MTSDSSDKYFVFSYNFQSDRFFVEWLSQQLRERGIPNWYLDDFDTDAVRRTLPESQRDTRYSEDWRLKPQNWQATYLHHVQHAQGVVVVHSAEGRASALTPGRGMWREADAVEYIRQDNPIRIKTIENPTAYHIPAGESLVDLAGLVVWAKEVLTLPPVLRPEVTHDERAAFNRKIDAAEILQSPEHKTRTTDWYELVRLDLYDVMWFCRRCSVESDNYILGTEVPPRQCPICGFKRYEAGYSGAGASALREGGKPSFKDKKRRGYL